MANDVTETESTESADPIVNRLLRTLSRHDYEQLLPHLEPIALPLRMLLYEPGADVTHAFFPVSGMASMVSEMKDGTVEVGTVGNDASFFHNMLGVHRPAVSLVASELSERGLLRYRRGAVTIVDRRSNYSLTWLVDAPRYGAPGRVARAGNTAPALVRQFHRTLAWVISPP